MSLLRDRRFALLVAGQAVNGIGSWCALVAMWGYAAYHFDAGPAQIALLSLSWSLPVALFGALGGVPVDRIGPRPVLIASDAAAGLVSLAMMFATSYDALVALGLLMGFTRLFSQPAFAALPPRLVDDDDLLRANAAIGAALHSSIAIGPLVAAAAIGAWGVRGAFAVDAVTYGIGILVLLPLRLRAVPRAARSRVRDELREGLGVVRDQRAVVALLALGASVYLVWGAYAVVEPIYVRDVLDRPPSTFALLQACFGAMLVVNGLLVGRAGERAARLGVLRGAAIASGLAAVLYVGTRVVGVAVAGIAVWGAATAWFVAPHRTMVQRLTPVEAHGRVLALDGVLQSWGHVVAMPLAGLLAAGVGVQRAALFFAVVPVTVALSFTARRRAVLRAAMGTGAEPAAEPAAA